MRNPALIDEVNVTPGVNMNRRKGEIIAADIRRQWPHRVELPDEAVRGTENCPATWGLAKELGAAPYAFSFPR
jgi:hypothetical protein